MTTKTSNSPSNFVDQLQSYNLFTDVFNIEKYTPLPADWLIVATDIKGSTEAIHQGRYKDVNTLGASSIISAINASSPEKIAYQFGGDGALITAPASHLEPLTKAFNELCLIAKKSYDLELRVSIWSVKDFLDRGYSFNILKHDIAPKTSVFMFQGTGLDAAEAWLKQSSEAQNLYLENTKTQLTHKFVEGLECRWNPLQSRQGSMVTALIKARDESKIVEIMTLVHQVINEKTLENHPLSIASLPVQWPPRHYKSEWKAKTIGLTFTKRYFTYLAVMFKTLFLTPIVWLFKEKIEYLSDLVLKSDFQKFDGMYRFVRDLSPDQTARLRALCQDLYDKGDIFYGLHESPTALMTCMVFSEENHLHFIDGSDGGYAVAATQLKRQMQ